MNYQPSKIMLVSLINGKCYNILLYIRINYLTWTYILHSLRQRRDVRLHGNLACLINKNNKYFVCMRWLWIKKTRIQKCDKNSLFPICRVVNITIIANWFILCNVITYLIEDSSVAKEERMTYSFLSGQKVK